MTGSGLRAKLRWQVALFTGFAVLLAGTVVLADQLIMRKSVGGGGASVAASVFPDGFGPADPSPFTGRDTVDPPGPVEQTSIAITGLARGAPASVSGTGSPEISLDGVSWSTEIDEIAEGDTLYLRIDPADNVYGTSYHADVTIGDGTKRWTVSTPGADLAPTGWAAGDPDPFAGRALSNVHPRDGAPYTVTVALDGFNTDTEATITASSGSATACGKLAAGEACVSPLTIPANASQLIVELTPGNDDFGASLAAEVTITGVTRSWPVTTQALDETPEGWAAGDPSPWTGTTVPAPDGTPVVSDGYLIAGVNDPFDVTLAGDTTARIGLSATGPWETALTGVDNGDTLFLQLTPEADTRPQSLAADVTIDGTTKSWAVTVPDQDVVPDGWAAGDDNPFESLALSSQSPGNPVTTSITLTGFDGDAEVTVTGTNGADTKIALSAGGPWQDSLTVGPSAPTLYVQLTPPSAGFGDSFEAIVTIAGVGQAWSVGTQSATFQAVVNSYGSCAAACGSSTRPVTSWTCQRVQDGATVDQSNCSPPGPGGCTSYDSCTYSYTGQSYYCSASCGTGTYYLNSGWTCRRSDGTNVNQSNCTPPPSSNGSCSNYSGCSYSAQTGGWSGCSPNSGTCGSGTQTRSWYCRRSDGTTVADSYCSTPSTSQSCTVTCSWVWDAAGIYSYDTPPGGNWATYCGSKTSSCTQGDVCYSGQDESIPNWNYDPALWVRYVCK